MPKILVCHMETSADAREAHLQRGNEAPDEMGVWYRNVFAADDGAVFCVADTAGLEQLLLSHRMMGVPMSRSDVHFIWHGSLATS